ncbi:hypothetical protein DPMN_005872 [Dreissena polymorpha]|uniref:Uncharacterized protein n=1 Tax=Dreissena polymorpha TaxID=45954 RepID=A0A9D4MU60_DREPO|nr:hypothetical protein DPMN_005872 [Dreissena polymorpha]
MKSKSENSRSTKSWDFAMRLSGRSGNGFSRSVLCCMAARFGLLRDVVSIFCVLMRISLSMFRSL